MLAGWQLPVLATVSTHRRVDPTDGGRRTDHIVDLLTLISRFVHVQPALLTPCSPGVFDKASCRRAGDSRVMRASNAVRGNV